MLKLREQWLTKIEEVRNAKMYSATDIMNEMGINYATYYKLLDPTFPPVSLRTMRKVRDYFENIDNNE